MRVLRFLVMEIMLLLLMSVTVKADVYANRDGKVISFPSLQSKVVDEFSAGEQIEIKYTSSTNWVIVKTENGYGFIRKNCLEQREYLGNFMCTAYAYTGNPCANGNFPSPGYTVACNSLPFETRIYIDGVGYRVVEDRGPDYGNEWLDIYMENTDACYQWGVQYCDVYEVKDYE